MKVVILAGGLGTRLAEETQIRPKPMAEIGEYPILWHIMKGYGEQGFSEFVVCLGYKGYMIKEYFANYGLHMSDFTVDIAANKIQVHQSFAEPWKVTLVDTGEATLTGGRIKRVREYLDDEDFCLTYGDGVADIDLPGLISFHKKQGRLATLTAVQPPGRFGSIRLEEDNVCEFLEKPLGDGGWINGGFFVLSPKVIDYIEGDQTSWEANPLRRLTEQGQVSAYKHRGFWLPMDTLRDKNQLESLWAAGNAPWKTW